MVKKARPVKVTKATKAVKVIKATKAKKPKKKAEQKPKPIPIGRLVYNSIVDTLEHNVLAGGEFDLPTILTRYLDKSHPKYNLGLHREYYLPLTGNAHFYRKGDSALRSILETQAGIIIMAIGEGIPVRKHEFDLPLCEEHK